MVGQNKLNFWPKIKEIILFDERNGELTKIEYGFRKKNKQSKMVFCYQNCTDLM